MKIGIVTGEYPPMQGGVGDYTREVAHALRDRGHAVSVLTSVRGNAADPGVTVSAQIERWSLRGILQARRWARAGAFEVINLQYETAAYALSPWVHALPFLVRPIPVVTTFHDLHAPYLFPKAGPLRARSVDYLARASARVVVTNTADAIALQKRIGTPIPILPIGSNIPTSKPTGYERAAWRSALGYRPGMFVIGFFGFMNATKGVDTLIRAVDKARNAGIEARLLLIGGRTGASDPENTAYADQIDALIKSLKLQSTIHWTGYANALTVSAHLDACDLIALPFTDGASFRRGSLMAALAHGSAILTTSGTYLEHALEHAALIVPPNDVPALADGLVQLARDPASRTGLAKEARALGRMFTWSQIAADLEDLFTGVITG